MTRKLLLIGLIALVVPCAAHAAKRGTHTRSRTAPSGATFTSIGPRLGFSVSPDQVVVGGQLVIGGFHPAWTINPSLEAGFGDHETVVALNFDGYYHFDLRNSTVRPYAGGGFGINFASVEVPPGLGGGNASSTDVGLNLVGGMGFPMAGTQKMFTEFRIGVGDIPSFKGLVGWNFKI